MSQFGLLIVANPVSLQSACSGWVTPLSVPVKRAMTNPFTGEPIEVLSYFPDSIEGDCVSLDELTEHLQKGKPLAIDFQLSPLLSTEFLDAAKPFLIANTEEGPVTLDQIPASLEPKVVEHFGQQMGDYAAEDRRRQEELSIFVFVYSF